MYHTKKQNSPGRGERHSAAWGKRWSMAMMLLLAPVAFGQGSESFSRLHRMGKFSDEMGPALTRAHEGSAGANEKVQVIVQYKQTPQAEQEGRMQRLGGRLNNRLHMVKGIALTLPVNALSALESDPEIASVTLDHPLKGLDDISNTATNVKVAWNAGYTGTGVTVAVIDSGINDAHPDLQNSAGKSRVLYHGDYTGTANTNTSGGKYDLYGHGTHVAGIIGGNGSLSGGNYAGVASNVNLVDLRALDLNGSGSDSTVIAAIQAAISLKSTYNIRVINLSLGRGIPESYTQDPLCQAVESAWKAGIVVVVAAGNYGRLSVGNSNGFGTITAPGNDPYVITVGAMKSNGSSAPSAETLASYSSKGPTTYDHIVKPDIVAPGNAIVSLAAPGATLEATYPAEYATGTDGKNEYFTLSGTSMATPLVAGAAALMLQQNANMTPDQVKARLMRNAYKIGLNSTSAFVPHLAQTFTSTYDLFSVGSGQVNVQPMLTDTNLTSATVGAALSPTAVYNTVNGAVSIVYGNATVGSNSVVWGSSVVWGASVVWGSNVNATSVVWGASLPWNSSALGSLSVVWGASAASSLNATSVVWGASMLSSNSAFSDAGDDEQ